MATDFICPAPLVVAETPGGAHTTTFPVYEDCVVPCPTIEYTVEEWSFLTKILTILVIISTALSGASLICHAIEFQKYFIRCMFISGFFFNGLVLSIFFITNGIDYSVTCDTNAHYIEKGPLCLFQAAFLIFLYIWVEIWSLIFAYDMYLHISSSVTAYDIPTLRYRYMLVAVTLSCVITAIPVFANNIGFDPEANVPFCMYMLSENKNYFWYIFMLPLMALLILATGYAIMGTVRMNEIFVGATSSSGRNKLTLSHAGSLSLSVSQAAGDEYLLNTAIDDSNDVGASSSRGIPSQGDSIKSAATSEQPLYHPPIGDAQCLSITNSSQQDYLNQVVSIYQSYETGGGCDNYSHGSDYGNPYVQFHDGGSDCGSEAYFPPPPPEDEEWPQRSGTSSYLSSQYSASRGAEYRDGANEDASFSVFSTVSDILTMGNPVLNQGLEAEYSPLAAQEEVLLQQGREGSPSSVHSKQFRSESGGQSFHTGSGSSQSQSHHTHSSDPISFASRAQSNTTSNARSSQRLAAYYNSSRSSFQRSINSWRLFIKATWKYNGLSIVFVLTFCLSTLVIGPFLFFLDHVWWSRAVEAGQEFTECLVQASMISPDQTQTGVDSYAREVCGAVPGHRPNQIMLYSVLIWVSSYGIIPSLLFGFCGRVSQLRSYLADSLSLCGCGCMRSSKTSTDSEQSNGSEQISGGSTGSSNSIRPGGTGNSLYTVNSTS